MPRGCRSYIKGPRCVPHCGSGEVAGEDRVCACAESWFPRPDADDCGQCHRLCRDGCTGPEATDCNRCIGPQRDGVCVDSCSDNEVRRL